MLKNIRYAVRTLLKRPAFTAIAVLTLGLGIGANSTIFTFLNAAIFEAIPWNEWDRVVFIWSKNPRVHGDRQDVSLADFNTWREQSRSFDKLAAFGTTGFVVTESGDPERIQATLVTANFFPLLESSPQLGRGFAGEEQRVGGDRVAVLSHGFWQRRFGGDSGVIGRSIVLDGEPRTIVGVMPRSFWFPRPETAVWLPLPLDADQPRDRRNLWVFGMLKQGGTLEQARAEMEGITSGLDEAFPDTNAGWRANVLLLEDALLKESDWAVMTLLVMTVMFVLLIACVNVSNLLLSRAIDREKEIAVRTALGASRRRLIGQLLLENGLLALAGGIVGLFVASWSGDILMRVLPHRAPTPDTLINSNIFALTMLLSLISVAVFGLVPAFRLSRTDVNAALKETGRSGPGGPRSARFRTFMVVTEVALTLVLLIGAGLMMRQSVEIHRLDPGFDLDRLLTFSMNLPASKYSTDESINRFYSTLLQHISALPGIESASATTHAPLASDGQPVRFSSEPQSTLPADEKPLGFELAVTPDYFRTLGIPIRGRSFSEQDNANTSPVAIISEAAARVIGADDPIGMRLDAGGRRVTVIGVTKDLMPSNLREERKARIYVPYAQRPNRALTVMLRTTSDPAAAAPAARIAVWSIDRNLPVDRVLTMRTIFEESVRGGSVIAALFAVFAGLALTLAVVGIYGVVSYSASQQTHEIGIRLALGASRGDVLRMIVGRAFLPVFAGIGIGLAGGFGVSRLLQGVLIGVSPSDPWTFAGVTVVLCGVALLASYLPAHRAMRVDPVIALRRF